MRRALGVALVLFSRVAFAATPADEALAESLFASGKGLMTERRFDEACAKFDAARKLSPGIGVTLWLGECHEKSGRLATAWLFFREAATDARARSDERAALADSRAKALEPKMARLRIVRGSFSGEILRDGRSVPEGALGEALPIDRGRTVVSFVGSGGRRDVTVNADDGQTYEVRSNEGTFVPDRPRLAARPPPAPKAPSHAAGFVLLGGAAVAAGVGTVFGLAASSKDADAGAHCVGNQCDADGVRLRDEAFERATVSTVAFVASGALALAGLLVVLGAFDGSVPRTASLRW